MSPGGQAGRGGHGARGTIVVVGAGIIGTMHAWTARRQGWDVLHLDREAGARGASVRNFGLVWVSGRAAGAELDLALRSRELWQDVANAVPAVGWRANGSLTVAQSPEELDVIEEAAASGDAAERGWRLLTAGEIRSINPGLEGKALGALHCALDAAVEPRRAAEAIRLALVSDALPRSTGSASTGSYRWLPERNVVEAGEGFVRDHRGETHGADRVVLCCGADHKGVAAPALADAPLRRVRLQMMETAPADVRLTTSVADGDSLRYYPAYQSAARDRLPPQDELAAAHAIQLLMVQRLDGGLTIGDTHQYEEPFEFAVSSDVEGELLGRAAALLGTGTPPVTRRWSGVYSQVTDESLYLRRQFAPGVDVVTGPGGRGMTLSAAIAAETLA